jgi:hypothetical protein
MQNPIRVFMWPFSFALFRKARRDTEELLRARSQRVCVYVPFGSFELPVFYEAHTSYYVRTV